ncbi:hypothetical protein [Hoeflea sp.]|uniref:hypothetical protein n=1 Tax=Hoeflea sp. TaxID=1940281 RepID=UPI003A901AE0
MSMDLGLTTARRVELALDHFDRVGDPGRAVYHALLGTREIIQAAVEDPALPLRAQHMALRAKEVLLEAAPILSEAVADTISPEDIYSGLGFLNKLIVAGDDGLNVDRINFASILAARLTIALHWGALQRRGFPLTRAATISRAISAPRHPDTPVH